MKFEITVFNQEVKDLLEQNQKHEFLNDVWAERNYIEIESSSMDQAKKTANRRYPKNQGYVVEEVIQTSEY
jgi:hypothetical protein